MVPIAPCHVDVPQAICLAGVARRDITPPVGIYHRMWGAATHDQSTGIHRPLTCTALAIAPLAPSEQATEKQEYREHDLQRAQIILAVDHCLLWEAELTALMSRVCSGTGLRADQVQVAFSHTHAAGLMDPARSDLPGGELIQPYLVDLAGWIVDAIQEALKTLAPSQIVFGQGRCSLATNRDFWDETSKQFVCGFSPTGIADDTIVVARFTVATQTLATVVNYACHPTTLAWDNTLISPDYVGAMRQVVEAATSAPCLFLQGASGDLGPRRGFVGDVAVADQNGRQLGHAAAAAFCELPPAETRFEYTGPIVSGATIGTWADLPLQGDLTEKHKHWQTTAVDVPLDYRADLPTRELTEEELARWMRAEHQALADGQAKLAQDCRAQVERMSRQLTRLQMLSLGDATHLDLKVTLWQTGDAFWIFLPGEHYQHLQQSLRNRFPNKTIVITTVCNGWHPGYLPTAACYGRGIYQEQIAIVAAGSLERLIESIGEQLQAWVA